MLRTASKISILIALALALLAVESPEQRVATDPKSVSSGSQPHARPVPVEALFDTRTVTGPSWSPDGRSIAYTTNRTGRLNLWKIAADGGEPVQLSKSDDRQMSAVCSPDGKWIVYQQDRGGGEVYDLFAIPASGGDALNLTDSGSISETSPLWSPDGSALAFDYKPRTSPITDVAVIDWSTRKIRKLTKETAPDRTWALAAWSRDGKHILANRFNAGRTDSSVYLIESASASARELTPHQNQILYTASALSPDGRTIALSSNELGGHENVALLDVATSKLTWVTRLGWEAIAGNFSPDGKFIAYIVNTDGRSEAYLYNMNTRQSSKLAFPEGLTSFAGQPASFSPDGRRAILTHQSSTRPADFWIYDLPAGKSRQLTSSASPALDPAALPPSQLVHYKSFDGMMISAFMWMPFHLERDRTNPGVVLPHGGPTGQTVDSFNRTAAALASRGYVCIAPNVRGSTGYGMAFQKANTKDLGGGDLQDEVYAARFLRNTGYVNPKKIGITGGSYGGYMTLMAIGKTPDVWAAAVEMYGIIDWYSMLQHEDPYLQQYEKSLLGDPEKDRQIYENASPIKFIRNEKAPLLVLQGENDIRVPKEEAEQVVSILRKEARTVDVHYYPNEGHGFAKRENQIDALRRTIAWFDHHLKGDKP